MSTLTLCYAEDGEQYEHISDHAEITTRLAPLGVEFQRWRTDTQLSATADQAEVLQAYAHEIEQLNQKYGFQSLDVVSIRPDHPNKAELRAKFLNEHTHDDFEIRFFVDGSGLFYIHLGDQVWMLLCEKGDLVSVPANTTHWFDMGIDPDFKCIRFFTTPNGWEGNFTADPIPQRFPDFDTYLAALG